ncbi:MAG: response regulator [Gemmatimonadaceae bacterium]|nr:response regulator [Gemmatimonadaceae bacterium]
MVLPAASQSDLTPIRVLVVDDDIHVRYVMVRLLASQGFTVLEADSTDAALVVLKRDGAVPLVISDVSMPGRDGRELLREIRAKYTDTAVMMLTGDRDVATAVECLKVGAIDYLAKPVQLLELRARVDKALAERQLAMEVRRLRARYRNDLERQVHELSRKNQAMFLAQVQIAVTMLEAKDPYTRGHSGRVAQFAVATARQMGITGVLLEQIRLGGELHDIGKIGTRDAVLNKVGPLTDAEFVELRRHTVDGEAMLSVLRDDHPEVLHIVRWHHERIDGTGFPDGLSGDQIPVTARIVSVVDAFDAMTTTRPYRLGQPAELAWAELDRGAGQQFDRDVISAFRAAQSEHATISR